MGWWCGRERERNTWNPCNSKPPEFFPLGYPEGAWNLFPFMLPYIPNQSDISSMLLSPPMKRLLGGEKLLAKFLPVNYTRPARSWKLPVEKKHKAEFHTGLDIVNQWLLHNFWWIDKCPTSHCSFTFNRSDRQISAHWAVDKVTRPDQAGFF